MPPLARTPIRSVHAAAACRPCAQRGRLCFGSKRPPDGPQVPLQMTAEQLRPTFEAYGTVEEITIILDKTARVSKGKPRNAHLFVATRPLVCCNPHTRWWRERGDATARRLRFRHLLDRGAGPRRNRSPEQPVRARPRQQATRCQVRRGAAAGLHPALSPNPQPVVAASQLAEGLQQCRRARVTVGRAPAAVRQGVACRGRGVRSGRAC